MWECLALFRLKSSRYFQSYLIVDTLKMLCVQYFKWLERILAHAGGVRYKLSDYIFYTFHKSLHFLCIPVTLSLPFSLPILTHTDSTWVSHLSFVCLLQFSKRVLFKQTLNKLSKASISSGGGGYKLGGGHGLGCIVLGVGVLKKGVAWSQ